MKQISRFTNVDIPAKVMNILNPIRHNDDAVMKYGIHLTVELCKILLQSVLCIGLHFFTLNRDKATTEVLKRVGLWSNERLSHKLLPWHNSDTDLREGENVRPIFWACRPDSYQYRTQTWDEFPNGRWGSSSQASFGQFRDYHLFCATNRKHFELYRQMWGSCLDSLQDVFDVFTAFIGGKENKEGVKVREEHRGEHSLAKIINIHLLSQRY